MSVRRRRSCADCAAPIEQPANGRPRLYCSQACRQRAWAGRRRPRPSDWWTPSNLRIEVLTRFPVALDAAAGADNTLVPAYLGPDHVIPTRRDAVAFDSWAGLVAPSQVVWLNPPYTPAKALSAFLARAVTTAADGTTVVGLVPASTGTEWWWRHIVEAGVRPEFLRGRLAFEGPHAGSGGGRVALWASAVVVWPGDAARREAAVVGR